jgi:D-inositol-3-phosphate glycosyltransferase
MSNSLTIFSPTIGMGLSKRIFGKDVANHNLFRSLVLYGGLDQIDFVNPNTAPVDKIRNSLIGEAACPTKLTSHSLLAIEPARQSGTLLRGSADIASLAWDRRRHKATNDYSLIGLIHTIAPAAIREDIGNSILAPTMPWDAIICTSPAVKTAMENMFADLHDYYGARFETSKRPGPQLPLIPLGVEASAFAPDAQSPQRRATLRKELGIDEDDMLVLWVGRLSYYEKAFPQPMMLAAQAAHKMSGKKVHFAMAGWFPDGDVSEKNYRLAASVHAPDVQFHIIDGTDKSKLAMAWSAADVFISLVDNVQETFGITPIEAMAAGLPVVVSDWDGYRYTVRDEQDGFLIPTLMGPPSPIFDVLAEQHKYGMKSYQQYTAVVAQHTAVSVHIAAERLAQLFASKELRQKMGASGRQRILDTFDWRIVAPQYVGVAQELANQRRSATSTPPALLKSGHHPARSEPFHAFANFPSQILADETIIRAAEGFDVASLPTFYQVPLTSFGTSWHGSEAQTKVIVDTIFSHRTISMTDLKALYAPISPHALELTILWLAKMGVVEWV